MKIDDTRAVRTFLVALTLAFLVGCGKPVAPPVGESSAVSGADSATKTEPLVPAEAIKWHDFESGLALAKAENKLLLVDFFADWCVYCVQMDEKVYADDLVIAAVKEDFIAVKVDVDDKKVSITYKSQEYSPASLAGRFEVRGLPTTLFLNGNGTTISARPGFIERDSFLHWLEKVQLRAELAGKAGK